MQYLHVDSDRAFDQLLRRLATAESIAFDTEFVSEDCYQPDLCLIQVATEDDLAVIDPKAVSDLTPFWELLTDSTPETIVHAGREELRFIWRETGRRPKHLFDVQIAAGLIGAEYPASYGNLISRYLGVDLDKSAQRTDWRYRPLTKEQVRYALKDVEHLHQLHEKIGRRLIKLDRVTWFLEEMDRFQNAVIAVEEDGDRWRKLPGVASQSARMQAVIRELWRMREELAEARNRPARQVMRDDLLMEIAKQKDPSVRGLKMVRGLERGSYQAVLPQLGEAVRRGLELPEEELPRPEPSSGGPQLTTLVQFLSVALAGLCRTLRVAPTLVGTQQDVRDFVRAELNLTPPHLPAPDSALSHGWRAELIGTRLAEVLRGELCLRVTDPRADDPLSLAPFGRS